MLGHGLLSGGDQFDDSLIKIIFVPILREVRSGSCDRDKDSQSHGRIDIRVSLSEGVVVLEVLPALEDRLDELSGRCGYLLSLGPVLIVDVLTVRAKVLDVLVPNFPSLRADDVVEVGSALEVARRRATQGTAAVLDIRLCALGDIGQQFAGPQLIACRQISDG